MNKYHYVSKNLNNKIIKGIIYAKDVDDLRNTLFTKKLYLLKYRVSKSFHKYIPKFIKIKDIDIINLFNELGIMLKAGIKLSFAVETLSLNLKNKFLANIINNIYIDLLNGTSLSSAFSKYSFVFSTFVVNMISVGERAGNLDDTFMKIAKWLENRAKMKNEIKQAASYPIFLLILVFIVVMIMSIFVMPMFSEIFKDFNAELPKISQIVLSITSFIRINFIYIILGILLTLIFLSIVKKIKLFKFINDFISSKFQITIYSFTYKFINGLSLFINNGLDLSKSISEMTNLVDNLYLKKKLLIANKNIKEGISVKDSLNDLKIFPKVFIEMISIGELTGEINYILENLNSYYEEELRKTIKKLTSLIEPTMILFIALIVGIVIISVFLPLLGIMDAIGA